MFQKRIWLAPGHVNGHLVLIFDNCTGQNKNKPNLWYCSWLHEVGIVKGVTLIFLIEGHTKQVNDDMFNLVKCTYHNKNLFMEQELDAAINNDPHIQTTPHKNLMYNA